jgi:class 3 adenylate cyclase
VRQLRERQSAGPRFCSRCGAPLGEAAPPQEERKLVSVLFIDLVDSIARADKADPEDVRDVLQLYHRESKACIEQYGGVLEKFIGDAVMAVFGAPVAHGDDAERAVRGGLRIALESETSEAAAEWAQRAVDVARRTRRLKYEARSLSTLGQALVRLGRHDDGVAALRSAVELADRIVSPYARWNARAALARTAYGAGRDDEAESAYKEAAAIVDSFSAALAPERASMLEKSPVVQEIRSAA